MPMPSLCLSWTPTKLLLMVFFLLFYSPTAASPTTFQFTGTLPSTSTAPLPQIEMNPGITTKLIITVKGMIDLIVFTFQEDPYQADSFNLFIKSNNQMDATQTASFPTIEYLTLSLDTSTNLLVLQGDKGFRISKFVREKEYSVQVQGYQQNGAGYGSDNGIGSAAGSSGSGSGRTTAYFILAGVIGGLFGLVLLIKGGSVLIRKIKRRLRKSSSIFSVNSRNSNKNGDLEGGGVTPVLAGEDLGREIYAPEFKCSLTLDEKGLIGDGEIESMQQQYQKKEFPSSLTSIESGMGKSTVASRTSLIPSTGSLQNIVMSKKGPQLAAITEEISYVKPVLPLGPLKVPPLRLDEIGSKRRHSHHGKKLTASKIMPANVPGRGQQVAKTMIELPPANVPGRGQQVAKTMIELPSHQAQKENRLDTKPNKADKQIITMKDIRNLVDRVMREKNNEDASVDVSDESSSKDDGGDTPNYFACMVCDKERRSAVVEPCGHVFACMNCTKRVMSRSKGCCALCSGKIKGYHALKG